MVQTRSGRGQPTLARPPMAAESRMRARRAQGSLQQDGEEPAGPFAATGVGPSDPRPAVGAGAVQRAWFAQLLCYVSWYALLWAGTAAYEGEPVLVKSRDLPLHWFDVLFRRAGAALLFVPWLLRASAGRGTPANGNNDRRVDLLWPGVIYTLQTVLRVAIYVLHVAGYIFTPRRYARDNLSHPPHVMSDHILLGAAVHAGLASEAALAALGWDAAAAAGRRVAALLLRAYSAAAASLALLVAAECYFTARYFHPPAEILLAAALGAAIFQAPLLVYARWALGRARSSSAVGGVGREPGLPAAKAVARTGKGH